MKYAGRSSLYLAGILLLASGLPVARADDSPPTSNEPVKTPAAPIKAAKPDGEPAPKQPEKSKPATPEKQDAGKTPPKRQPDNPLSRLLRGIFTPSRPSRGVNDGDSNEDARESNSGDETDKRAPHDPEQFGLLKQAIDEIQSQNWSRALEILEFLLERSNNATVRLSTGRHVPVSEEANRLLARLPNSVRENYRLRHGPAATQRLAEALAEEDGLKLSEVATRYFHTPAGFDAADRLGTLHFDRGEFGLAARWYSRLMEADAPVTHESAWRLKAILAFRHTGNQTESERLLASLSTGDAPGELEIGGRRMPPKEWLDGLGKLPIPAAAEVDEWAVFGGDSARSAIPKGGDPLLLQRWNQPLSENQPLLEQITALQQDLTDLGRATIPSSFPLMVDGKIVYRTLRGVQVLDAQTGDPLWETRDGISPEQLLGASTEDPFDENQNFFGNRRRFNAIQFNREFGDYFGGPRDAHPLAGLLFRNGAYGVLSSDGRQLFVIEDHAVFTRQQGYYGGELEPEGNDPLRRSWSTNRLVSYDLRTGHPLWSVGGVARSEQFDLPLAGTYFLGAPLPDRGELLVIGERDGQIHLHALDPSTGSPRWSQLIAFADTKIDRDLARRWWSAQVAVSGGIVLCPTTVGWLVAVDRLDHSLLWTQRYTPSVDSRTSRERRDRDDSMLVYSELNAQWAPAAPMIAGNHVVFTPPEESTLVCLNLDDGSIAWQEPKGDDGLYVAGVVENQVVIVGRDSIKARSLDEGKSLWTLRMTSTDGRPSGFGVISQGKFHIPLSSGQLWSINLSDGTVASKSYLSSELSPLGNLALYRGMLISQGAESITSFEQREAVAEEIQRRKQENPRDPFALLREAEIRRVERRYLEALSSLREIRAAELPSPLLPRYRSTFLECLAEVIRSDSSAGERELDELASFATSVEEKWTYRRLSAAKLEARNEFEAAFELLLKSAGELLPAQILVQEGPDVQVELTPWLAGKLSDLWDKLPEQTRSRQNYRLANETKKSLEGDTAVRERARRLYAFHPSIIEVENRLVDDYVKSGEVVRAENILKRMARRREPTVAAAALARLAQLLRDAGLPRDADQIYDSLESRFADVRLPNGREVREQIAELRKQNVSGIEAVDLPAISWGEVDFKLERTGVNSASQQVQKIDVSGDQSPFFHDHRFRIDERHQRLEVIGARDESQHWLLPLRSSPRPVQGDHVVARASGHLLTVLHRDVLHCLSPIDRKVLWTRVLDSRSSGSGYYRAPQNLTEQPLRKGLNFLARNALLHLGDGNGMIASANAECVCLYGRRQFTVLDATTGETLWTHENVPPNAAVFATDDIVYFVPPERNQAAAFRVTDGRKIDDPGAVDRLSATVAILSGGMVLVETESKSRILGLIPAGNTTIRLYDPLSRTDRWKVQVPGGTLFSLLNDNRLVCLEATGTPTIIDLETGTAHKFSSGVPAADLKDPTPPDFYALADRHRLFICMNAKQRSREFSYPENFPSINVNGRLYAFDIATGKPLWEPQAVSSQNLISRYFEFSPALLFVKREMIRNKRGDGSRQWVLSLMAIDKQTGRKLIDTQIPYTSPFRMLDLNMAERFIELNSSNQRLRLQAVDRGT